jgi:ribosomal protein L7Ae-like RNA K-turn-binding protein
MDKESNFKSIYDMKAKAAATRANHNAKYNSETSDLYKRRIAETKNVANGVNNVTKQLEQQEAHLMAKLQ